MKEIKILESILASNFHYNFYEDAVKNIRSEINEIPHYQENWNDVMKFVLYRKFAVGEPLKLIQNSANLVLHENSDEEAYRWLDLFLVNVLNSTDVIPYQNSSSV